MRGPLVIRKMTIKLEMFSRQKLSDLFGFEPATPQMCIEDITTVFIYIYMPIYIN